MHGERSMSWWFGPWLCLHVFHISTQGFKHELTWAVLLWQVTHEQYVCKPFVPLAAVRYAICTAISSHTQPCTGEWTLLAARRNDMLCSSSMADLHIVMALHTIVVCRSGTIGMLEPQPASSCIYIQMKMPSLIIPQLKTLQAPK